MIDSRVLLCVWLGGLWAGARYSITQWLLDKTAAPVSGFVQWEEVQTCHPSADVQVLLLSLSLRWMMDGLMEEEEQRHLLSLHAG